MTRAQPAHTHSRKFAHLAPFLSKKHPKLKVRKGFPEVAHLAGIQVKNEHSKMRKGFRLRTLLKTIAPFPVRSLSLTLPPL